MFSQNHLRIAAGRIMNWRALCGYIAYPRLQEIDEDWIDAFLADYRLSRNIPGRNGGMPHRASVVDWLRENHSDIAALTPGDAVALCQMHQQLAAAIQAIEPPTRFRDFPSHASKLIWALNPRSGIVYDRFAAIGLARIVAEQRPELEAPSPDVRMQNYLAFIGAWNTIFIDDEFQQELTDTMNWITTSFDNISRTSILERHFLDQCLVLAGTGNEYPDFEEWRVIA